MMKRACVSLLLYGAVLCVGCRQSSSSGQDVEYKTIAVVPENRTLNSEYTARLEGRQEVEIRPEVGGLIVSVCFGEGQKVRKGQVLFVIDRVPYEAALNEAEANVKSAEAKLATAELNLDAILKLREQNVVGDYDVSSAQNELAATEALLTQAKAQEVNARNNLSYTEVKSPVNGVAGMITYRVGTHVDSGIAKPLVTVSDSGTMHAYFSMTESQVLDMIDGYGSLEAFMKGMPPVSLRMSNGKIYPEHGRISAVSGIVTSGTGAVTIRADFPNEKGLLISGGSASVLIPSVLEKCIVIPQGATFELQDRVFAYKVVDGKATAVPVEVFRLNNGTEYVVESGLEEGDVIIAEGAGLVREGAVVKTMKGEE